jgi:hypothetical protein
MCVHFDVIPDGQLRNSHIVVGDHPLWRGHRITSLRLDREQGAFPGVVRIESVRGNSPAQFATHPVLGRKTTNMQDEQAETQGEQTETQVEEAEIQDEPTKKRSALSRKALPVIVLLLLIALALNFGTLRDLVTKRPTAASARPTQEVARSLGSPDATNQILAKLELHWSNPGPPVLVFSRPG